MDPTMSVNYAVRALLKEYYIFVDTKMPDSSIENLRKGQYATPIAYRKDVGLTVLDAGVTTLNDKDTFHSVAWLVMETVDKTVF